MLAMATAMATVTKRGYDRTMNISDEAVEAAAKYLAGKFKWNGDLLPLTAREVLEAAAPFLMVATVEPGSAMQEAMAIAWDQGYDVCYDDGGKAMNPYHG